MDEKNDVIASATSIMETRRRSSRVGTTDVAPELHVL